MDQEEIARNREIRDAIASNLEDLRRDLGIPAHWLLTLIVRNPQNSEQEMVVSQDSTLGIMMSIARSMRREEVI